MPYFYSVQHKQIYKRKFDKMFFFMFCWSFISI